MNFTLNNQVLAKSLHKFRNKYFGIGALWRQPNASKCVRLEVLIPHDLFPLYGNVNLTPKQEQEMCRFHSDYVFDELTDGKQKNLELVARVFNSGLSEGAGRPEIAVIVSRIARVFPSYVLLLGFCVTGENAQNNYIPQLNNNNQFAKLLHDHKVFDKYPGRPIM